MHTGTRDLKRYSIKSTEKDIFEFLKTKESNKDEHKTNLDMLTLLHELLTHKDKMIHYKDLENLTSYMDLIIETAHIYLNKPE